MAEGEGEGKAPPFFLKICVGNVVWVNKKKDRLVEGEGLRVYEDNNIKNPRREK